MSQQKVFFALVLVAGCVALASSQSMSLSGCTQGAQKTVAQYQQTLQESVTKLTNQMGQQGQSSANIEQFTSNANQLMSQISSLADTDNFSLENVMNTYFDIIRSQTKLVSSLANPMMGVQAASNGMDFATAMIKANSQFMSGIAQACVPQLRGVKLNDAK